MHGRDMTLVSWKVKKTIYDLNYSVSNQFMK